MKRLFCFVFLFVFLLSTAAFEFANGLPAGLTDKEKASWELIDEVKVFEKSLGMKPTENFLHYKAKEDSYNLLFYCRKDVMPFSYLDPQLVSMKSTIDNLEGNIEELAKIGVTPEEYDIYFYTTQGLSGGTVITKSLLNSDPEEIVAIVLHEDFHDNVSIPFHFNEAAAVVFGYGGMCKFFGYDPSNVLRIIHTTAKSYDFCHDELSLLVRRYANGKGDISLAKFMIEKKIALARLEKRVYRENVTAANVAQNHSYFHYYGLILQLFKSFDYEPAPFLRFLNDVPYKVLIGDEGGRQKYFDETRSVERGFTSYVSRYLKSHIKE